MEPQPIPSPSPPLPAHSATLDPHDLPSSHHYVALLDEPPSPRRPPPLLPPSQRSTEPSSPSSSTTPVSSGPSSPHSDSPPGAVRLSVLIHDDPLYPAPPPQPSPPVRQCRICLEEGGPDLIIPCLCRGTAQFVHRSCLDTWRLLNRQQAGFHTCPTCGFTYACTASLPDSELNRRQRVHRLRVLRDVSCVLLLAQSWLVGLAALISLLDALTGNHLTGIFPDSAPRWLIAYLFSAIFSLAFIGLLGEMAALCGWDGSLQQRDQHPVRADFEELCRTCGFTGCDCSEGGGGADDCGPAMIICLVFVLVFVLFAVLGIVYGMWYASQLVGSILGRHVRKGWYRVDVERHPVKDWTGQDDALHLHAAVLTPLFAAQPQPQPPTEADVAHT